MKHIDLFSGIGGFALAVDRVWGNVEHIFVDNDRFCQEVLKKHWPEAPIFGDIREFTADTYRDRCAGGSAEINPTKANEQTQRRVARRSPPSDVYLLTGGFPCQPFSQAGRRKGTEDDRHLWPQMLRVIREFRPQWVVGENVAGFVTWGDGVVLETVCADLEKEGYEVQPLVIPAVAVGAPHRRDRVWIVAHAENSDDRGNTGEISQKDEQQAQERQEERIAEFSGSNKFNASDSKITKRKSKRAETWERRSEFGRSDWSTNWLEVASTLCDVAYGLPRELVRPDGERDRNYPWWRTQALKAGGNSIVPQVAEEIMKAIKLVAPFP